MKYRDAMQFLEGDGHGFIQKFLRMVKLVTFFLCAGMVAVYADSYSQNMTVNIQNGKLTDLFEEIQKQSDFSVFYNDKVLEQHSLTLSAKDKDLHWVLRKAFENRSLTYQIQGRQITIQSVQEQLLSVTGRVYDQNEPPGLLPGASVSVKNTTRGTTTDVNGSFTIEVSRGEVLVFSMVGFVTEEFTVTRSEQNFSISLKEDLSALDEVIVTGMTEQQKKHIASSVASLDVRSNIVGKPITSLSQSLQGGVTGIQVRQGSALPGGDAATLNIRGISTLNNSDPLVLVDGVPMDMNFIDPMTVESITILKDAAAAAIYGARAANGVVVVTTKRGVPGRVVVSYDGYYGVQSPNYLSEMVDAPTFMRMYNEALQNNGNAPLYSQESIDRTIAGDDPLRYPNTDWVGLMINKAAPITNHSLSLSGGNTLARFAISAQYINQQGMTPVTSNDRYNVRANTTVTLSDKFVVNLDVLAILNNWTRPYRIDGSAGNRILEDLHRVPPTILPKYPDIGAARAMYGRYFDIVNPLAVAEIGGSRKRENGQAGINFQPKWEVIPGLNLRGQFSFRLNSDVTRDSRETYNFFDFFSGQLVQTWGQARASVMSRTTYYYLSASADYTRRIGKHHFFGMAGYSQEQNNSGSWDVWSILSGFSKLNYSYEDRFLVEAVARVDGSSRFGPGNKYGFFPSVALGWNLHNENFLKGSELISNWKLRASYGALGNQNIDLYRYQSLINNSTGVESVWGNPGIKWETVKMLDLGMDIGIFKNNKLEVVLDYYDKLTKDMIFEPQVSYVGGLGVVPVNAGEVRNRGFEASVNYLETINENLSVSVRPGFSYNRNTILHINGQDIFPNSATINREGESVNNVYGYRSNGLLQRSDFDEAGSPLIPIVQGSQPGDIRYVDMNGDGEIDASDMSAIGDPTPRVNYFANFRFAYKKFDIEFLLQGTGKADVPLTGMLAYPMDMTFDGGVPTTYYAANYWTPDRTDAIFPRLNTSPTNNKFSSDFWFQNAAYVRMKYIQLGYNYSSEKLTRFGIRQLRIYLNAQNPFTITDSKLIDPETRGNQWTYGMMKMYTTGINLQF